MEYLNLLGSLCWGFEAFLNFLSLMDPTLPLPPDLVAFKKWIATSGKRIGGPTQNFVNKVDI